MTMPSGGSHTAPDIVYADAPRILVEISWVAGAAINRLRGHQAADREFRLRKAALLDRIALDEEATYSPQVAAKAVDVAEDAARRIVEYDGEYCGLSSKGADIVTGADCRDYVREQYRVWSLTALH